jgi:Endonuclease V (EC 3.1.21.-)
MTAATDKGRIPPIDWRGNLAAARDMQLALAREVSLRDGWNTPLRHVAGFDIGFEDGGATTVAAAVLLDADSLETVASRMVRIPTRMPYVPGFLSFRELPALLEALQALPFAPDLALVDGHGIAHPRRLGIAAHFGVATGLPSIGVAKKVLVGKHASCTTCAAPSRHCGCPARARRRASRSAGRCAARSAVCHCSSRPATGCRWPRRLSW